MRHLHLAAAIAAAASLPIAAAAPQRTAPVYTPGALTADQQLARDIYKELIEINTGVTTGNVTTAAVAMAKRFRDAGIPEADIFVGGPRPEKYNVVARIRGRSGAAAARKPILLLAHLDVVEALKSDWSPDLDPFVFTERDGYYYGRGTSDDKAMASIFVANLLRMKREGFVPARDIILALTADEEGGPANGAEWLVKNHRDLVDAAFVINEGGGGALRDGKPFAHSVQATEKVYVDFTVEARNRGGHSSVPRPDNAIYQLAEGLTRLGRYRFPVELNEVTRSFLERTAAVETPENAAAMRALASNPHDEAAAVVLSKTPRYNSTLRTTCVATMLRGGHAPNALPQLAAANVNCRILPNTSAAAVRDTLVRVLGDTSLKVSAAPTLPPTSPSPLLPELFGPVERLTREMFGNIPVIPTMGTGATDSKFFREAGIPAYGVSGLFSDPDDSRAHGRDERMLVKSFYDGQEFLYRLVKELASAAPTNS
jgi:acetylornithine deacetylase/succinyl-diaminopimelate desuccinylase-like protein